MQQFQSLQRLLLFYTLTLLTMLSLYYFALFDDIKTDNKQQSIDTFETLQHAVTEHAQPLNSEIQEILSEPSFAGISYQIIFMMPSGQTHIHRYVRPNERAFPTVTFPNVITSLPSDSNNYGAYTLNPRNLTGTIELESGHKLYIILRHKPLEIDWISYRYWLPLMTAIMFFIMALLYTLNRQTNWQQLIVYTDNLSAKAKDAYLPPPFVDKKSTSEFLRLGHALSRISYQLHSNHRRIQTLQHRLERLVEQAPLPMVMIMRHGQISFFNQRFERVFDTSFQSDTTYQLTDFVSADDESVQLLLQKLSSLRVTRTLNVRGIENQQAYQLHITPWFGEHGQVHGFTVLLNNVNELVNQNTQLQQKNQQLQGKIDELSELKPAIYHELHQPLETIIDTLEAVNTDTFSIQQHTVLQTLTRSSDAMLTSLNDMLGMEEIDVKKTHLKIESVDIYKLGQHINDLVIEDARRQGLELLYFFDPDCPRHIDTDRKRLCQVLLSLLDNAITSTLAGSVSLTIEAFADAALPLSVNDSVLVTNDDMTAKNPHNWVRFSLQHTAVDNTSRKQTPPLTYVKQTDVAANDQIQQPLVQANLAHTKANTFAQLLGGFLESNSSDNDCSTINLYLPCRRPSYQPVYHLNEQLTKVHLIAVVNQTLGAEHLQRLCDYLSIPASIYTTINSATIKQLTKQLAKDGQTLAPVLLLDYEYYESNAIVFPKPAAGDDKNINDSRRKGLSRLLANISLPTILLSMKPERRIPSMLLDQCDGFLAKPLDNALLLSELLRLTLPVRQTLVTAQSTDTDKFDTDNLDNDNLDNESRALVTEVDGATIDISDHKTTNETAPPLILVVEDSPTNQKIACKILTKLGYRTVVAEDGQQALSQLQAQHEEIALILMDCRMPVMDGLQATQAIRAQGDDIPIVALTANNTAEDRDACFEVGMDEFLTKPIDKNKLQSVLQSLIKD